MKKTLLVIVSVLALAVPTAAFAAGSSTCSSYDQQLCQVANANANRATADASATASTSSASTLPFTGLDVGLLFAGGAVLLVTGLVVRRFSRGVE